MSGGPSQALVLHKLDEPVPLLVTKAEGSNASQRSPADDGGNAITTSRLSVTQLRAGRSNERGARNHDGWHRCDISRDQPPNNRTKFLLQAAGLRRNPQLLSRGSVIYPAGYRGVEFLLSGGCPRRRPTRTRESPAIGSTFAVLPRNSAADCAGSDPSRGPVAPLNGPALGFPGEPRVEGWCRDTAVSLLED